jgi:hypothetical protein
MAECTFTSGSQTPRIRGSSWPTGWHPRGASRELPSLASVEGCGRRRDWTSGSSLRGRTKRCRPRRRSMSSHSMCLARSSRPRPRLRVLTRRRRWKLAPEPTRGRRAATRPLPVACCLFPPLRTGDLLPVACCLLSGHPADMRPLHQHPSTGDRKPETGHQSAKEETGHRQRATDGPGERVGAPPTSAPCNGCEGAEFFARRAPAVPPHVRLRSRAQRRLRGPIRPDAGPGPIGQPAAARGTCLA